MIVNISNTGLVAMTNKLEKLKKSALPIAIGNTLNQAAFDVKQNTMLRSANNNFINRQKNFFKVNSKVKKATGFNIKSMKAEVGFKPLTGNNYAVEDLQQQEQGGTINKKSFIPLVQARKGKTKSGLVKPNMRLSAIKNIVNTKDIQAKNKRQKFVLAAAIAGKGGFVLRDTILYRIDTAPKSGLKNKKTVFKSTAIYSFKKGRRVHVKSTSFMKEATLITSKKLDDFFIQNGERQVNKVWK